MPYMSRPLAAYADRRNVLSCYRAGYGVHLVAKMQVTMVSPVEVSGVVPVRGQSHATCQACQLAWPHT